MKKLTILPLAILWELSATESFAESPPINVLINDCIQQVHQKPAPAYDFSGDTYRSFDAFFNPSTRQIESYGSKEALFAFDKCMARNGSPIDRH